MVASICRCWLTAMVYRLCLLKWVHCSIVWNPGRYLKKMNGSKHHIHIKLPQIYGIYGAVATVIPASPEPYQQQQIPVLMHTPNEIVSAIDKVKELSRDTIDDVIYYIFSYNHWWSSRDLGIKTHGICWTRSCKSIHGSVLSLDVITHVSYWPLNRVSYYSIANLHKQKVSKRIWL